jgi:hypothetical protein
MEEVERRVGGSRVRPDWNSPVDVRHDVCVNDRTSANSKATFLPVRFGERPRQLRIAVGLTILLAFVVLAWNRYAAAALLIVVPVVLLVRHQRRALVIVRPSGPIVVKGWWHDTSVSPSDITKVQWQLRGDTASLRLVLGDSFVNCQSVAIPTGGKPRPQDREWPAKVAALIEVLEDVGVHPFALEPLRVAER